MRNALKQVKKKEKKKKKKKKKKNRASVCVLPSTQQQQRSLTRFSPKQQQSYAPFGHGHILHCAAVTHTVESSRRAHGTVRSSAAQGSAAAA